MPSIDSDGNPENVRKSFTNQYQKHKASSYCYLIKCFNDNIFKPKLVQYTAKSLEEGIPQMFV